MYDIILVSVPYSSITTPPLGISVLGGVLNYHGYKSKCLDLSMMLYKECEKNDKNFESVQLSLVTPSEKTDPFVEEFLQEKVKEILEYKPKYIGISVFSFMAHFSTMCFAKEIRRQDSAVKIVVGGPGVGTTLSPEIHLRVAATQVEKVLKYGDFLKKRNLVDFVVYGDGEEALLELLNTNGSSYVEEYKIYNYKKEFPFANFDDYDFRDYKGQLGKGFPQIPVFTSKGCVRNCDFCDVNVIQKKFRFRQGKNVVKELMYLADKYGIRDFNFADSLVNGSLSSMLEWVEELAIYNKNNPDRKITWSGSWICRPIGQIKEPVYELLALSGCKSLAIGVESGSNSVLLAMDKKTNVEALFYETEQFRKNNIGFMTLLIIGHWSEKWNDFLDTLKMLYHLADYVRTGQYIAVSIGATLGITKNTPLEKNTTNNKIDYVSYFSWWTSTNPSLTAKERYFRLLLIEKFCQEFHLPLMERVLPYAYTSVLKEFDTMRTFYNEKTRSINKEKQYAEFYYENFELLVKEIEKTLSTDLQISLEVESHVVNDDPVLEIYHNKLLLQKTNLNQGVHSIALDIDQSDINCISFVLSNKNSFDTVVDDDNNIVKDKFLLFKKIEMNGIDIVADPEFYNTKVHYVEDNNYVSPKFGLWKNHSEIQINYTGIFKSWHNKNSKKNSILGAEIISEITMSTTQSDEHFRKELINLLKKFEY